jgi:hypothetical protein
MNYGKYTPETRETQNYRLNASSNDADGWNANNAVVRRRIFFGNGADSGNDY